MAENRQSELVNQWLNQVVGQRIKVLREGRFTQQKLADQVGLNRSSIAKIEAGTQRVTVDTLFLIAKALEKETDYFLPRINEVPSKRPSTKSILKRGLVPDGLNKEELESVWEAIQSTEQK